MWRGSASWPAAGHIITAAGTHLVLSHHLELRSHYKHNAMHASELYK
jgi:hypothetical protein